MVQENGVGSYIPMDDWPEKSSVEICKCMCKLFRNQQPNLSR
jgi:hypothetical protein